NQYFYAPTAPSEASSLPPTFTGFAGVGNGAFFANPRIALAEAQNPQPDPLAQTLYGNRVFHTQLAAGLTYQQSERLSWHFFLSALRLESLPVTTSGGDRGEGLIAASTSVSAEMRLRYLWSPRTTLTYDLSEARTLSRVEDVYTTRAIAGIAHALSPHWQAEMHAGESQLSPRWELYPVPAGFGYLAGASLAFQTFGHTFSGSVSRQAGDSYGIGAASTLMSSASWNWRRPGSDWSLRGIFAWQKLRQGAGIEDWTATAAVNRTFGNHLAAQIAYVYLKLSQTTIAGLHSAQSSVRASITWYPQETHR
ncbi:MAG: hypothetical protein JO099_06825, partial [Acidobacteriia bacterium]|nr:hypothetical protein [Terriglobia bacterium]